ncbi:MAG TPA: hypothetical protein ENK50_06785 [Sedimenticola sp.]|nr:hypothetical protein [Sedimenticola sp.]
MELNIVVGDYSMNLNLPQAFLDSSRESFDRLDRSMDQGIQLGQEWVAEPDQHQRCQAAADRLLTALETHNEGLAMLSAGYIVSRMPGVKRVWIDNGGEPGENRFE